MVLAVVGFSVLVGVLVVVGVLVWVDLFAGGSETQTSTQLAEIEEGGAWEKKC